MGQKDMPRRVIVEVSDGCASVVQLPTDVTLEIRDYDIEGVDADQIDKDPEGVPCTIAVYRDPL